MPLDVVEQPLQRPNSPRATYDSSVEPDAHHPRTAFPTAPIQPVEYIRAVTKEILAGRNIAAPLHAAVIAVKRVRDDQLRARANGYPVRQIIVTGITVIQKRAVLRGQPPSVGAGAARVP